MRRPGSTVIQCKLSDSWQWPLETEEKEKQIRGMIGGVCSQKEKVSLGKFMGAGNQGRTTTFNIQGHKQSSLT